MVAVAGIALLVLVAPGLRDRALRQAELERVDAGAGEALTLQEGDETAPYVAPANMPSVIRPVAPQLIVPPPIEHRQLERTDARDPLSPIGRAHVPSEGPPKEMVLHRPLVRQAGMFEAMGYRIVLPGLVVTAETQFCGEGDAAWPCGIHARTAFRNWLRGRALACVVPPAPPTEPVITPCMLGKSDAGAWLVAQGWVLSDPADGRYDELEQDARELRRGLHGAGPPGARLPGADP